MSIVIKAGRTEEGIIVHHLSNGESKKYLAVRGGISWPLMAENLPGYFCIIGEELMPAAQRKNQRGKLHLLSEYEASDILTSLSTFSTKLTDAATLYDCDVFYTVIEEFQGEDYRGYVETFHNFTYEKQVACRLEEAPWSDRPDLGLYHIRSWMDKGLLELPEGKHSAKSVKARGGR